MRMAAAAWTWSLDVVARSPALLVLLTALVVLWGFGAYEWLWLAESSALLLLLALFWGLAQILIGLSVLAGTVSGATQTATQNLPSLRRLSFVTLDLRLLARTAVLTVAATPIILLALGAFSLEDTLALKVASFLTYMLETAVSPKTIERIFWVMETVISVMLGCFLLSFLIMVLRTGWREAWRQSRRMLADCCWRAPFWTGLLSLVVFGGLAYVLTAWHPEVTPGFWDFAQLALRTGGAVLLLVIGWLFLLLSLAKLILPPDEAFVPRTDPGLSPPNPPQVSAGS